MVRRIQNIQQHDAIAHISHDYDIIPFTLIIKHNEIMTLGTVKDLCRSQNTKYYTRL